MGKIILCAAHELNSTLDEIKGHLSLVQEKGNVPEEVVHHLSETMKGLHEMSLTIGSLLSYANPLKAPRTTNNLLNLLQHALGITIPLANEQKVQVSFNFPSKFSQVKIKRDLYQVFLNIIKSALKAMPQGGTLQLFGNFKPQGIEINFLYTCTGLSPHEGSQDGEMHSSTEERSMGLELDEKILRRNGVKIYKEPQPGMGTKVRVLLSRSESSPSA